MKKRTRPQGLIHVKRSPTVNPTTILVALDADKDVTLEGPDVHLAMNRDEARKLADLLTLVAEG